MLGSVSDADDAVQESWLRLSRLDSDAIGNLPTWATAVVARVSMDMLRSRWARREDYAGSWLPEPVVSRTGNRQLRLGGADPASLARLWALRRDMLAEAKRRPLTRGRGATRRAALVR